MKTAFNATSSPASVNPLIAVTSMATELLSTHTYADLQGVLSRDGLKTFSSGNLFCALVEKKNQKILQQFEMNFPADEKAWILSRVSDTSFFHGLNDSNFSLRFSLPGYHAISYGLSRFCEKRAGLFLLSKPMVNVAGSMNLIRVLVPYLHMALNNVHYLENAKSKIDLGLSKREIEVLRWISKGKTNQEIGIILGVSCFTVKNHISNIYTKLEAVNRAQAIDKAIEMGCLS